MRLTKGLLYLSILFWSLVLLSCSEDTFNETTTVGGGPLNDIDSSYTGFLGDSSSLPVQVKRASSFIDTFYDFNETHIRNQLSNLDWYAAGEWRNQRSMIYTDFSSEELSDLILHSDTLNKRLSSISIEFTINRSLTENIQGIDLIAGLCSEKEKGAPVNTESLSPIDTFSLESALKSNVYTDGSFSGDDSTMIFQLPLDTNIITYADTADSKVYINDIIVIDKNHIPASDSEEVCKNGYFSTLKNRKTGAELIDQGSGISTPDTAWGSDSLVFVDTVSNNIHPVSLTDSSISFSTQVFETDLRDSVITGTDTVTEKTAVIKTDSTGITLTTFIQTSFVKKVWRITYSGDQDLSDKDFNDNTSSVISSFVPKDNIALCIRKAEYDSSPLAFLSPPVLKTGFRSSDTTTIGSETTIIPWQYSSTTIQPKSVIALTQEIEPVSDTEPVSAGAPDRITRVTIDLDTLWNYMEKHGRLSNILDAELRIPNPVDSAVIHPAVEASFALYWSIDPVDTADNIYATDRTIVHDTLMTFNTERDFSDYDLNLTVNNFLTRIINSDDYSYPSEATLYLYIKPYVDSNGGNEIIQNFSWIYWRDMGNDTLTLSSLFSNPQE